MTHSLRLACRSLTLVLVLVLGAAAPASDTPWPAGVHLPAGTPVSEDYRLQFGACDREGSFRGQTSRYTKSCADDPNAVTALRRLPGGAIAYVSKLAVDLDGSAFACGPDHGRMDQCPTTLMLRDAAGREVPVDADTVPYVVIPDAGPPEVAGEFTRLTQVQVGDYGVVIASGRTVPVIVADTGPYSKLGEGSLALHRALGHEQCVGRKDGDVCRRVDDEGESITADVTTVLFPGSATGGLTPATIAAAVSREGTRRWGDLHRGDAAR
ncbi:MAG: hypothetical protein ACRYHC_11690 [Janthinobacterium lividum]